MKTYVLTVSRTFPSTHKRKGDSTFFVEKIKVAVDQAEEMEENGAVFPDMYDYKPKLHTIRSNYKLWERRIDEVQSGNAILSLRYWSGKPYNSKQVEFAQFNKDSGIGIQKLKDPTNFVFAPVENSIVDWQNIAANDGLIFDDFCEWFNVRQDEPMAIIHFTKFRY